MFKEIKRVFNDTVVYGLGSLLPKAAGIVLMPIYTRYLSKTDYGIYSFATMLASMVGVVLLFGQNGSLTLYFRQAQGSDKDRRSLLFTVFLAVEVFATLAVVGLVFAGPYLMPYITKDPSFTFSPYLVTALAIAWAGLPLAMMQAVNRAQGRPKRHTSFQLAQFLINTGFTLYFVVALGQGAFGSLKGTLIAAASVSLVATVLLVREMTPRFSVAWLKKSLNFGLPLVPHYFAGWLLTFADRALLGRMTDLSQVGTYSVAYNLSMALNLFSQAINQAWGPIYYDLADTEEGRKKLPRLTTIYATAVGILAMAYVLYATDVLKILAAPKFWDAEPIVPIIVAGYFFFALYMLVSAPIFHAKKTGFMPLVSAAAAGVNIVINLVLIPVWGIAGAAWATFGAYLFMALVARFAAERFSPGAFEDGRLARLIGVFLLALAASMGIVKMGLPLIADIAIKVPVLLALIALLVVARVVTVDELRSVVDRLRTRKKRAPQPLVADEHAAEQAASEAGVSGHTTDDTGFDADDAR